MTSPDEPGALAEWAGSGAMALTGRSGGPPLAAPGNPAGQVRAGLSSFARSVRERTGAIPSLPGTGLLAERAAIAGLRRNGPWSCGGAFRTLPAADGWIGLSLSRPDDLSLVPALIESAGSGDPWAQVQSWSRDRSVAAVVERIHLLGLAGCAVPSVAPVVPDRDPVVITPGGSRRHRREHPLVVDLSALWAGPLCAHLLGLGGADVIKVESGRRPDGTRSGPRAFFDLMHGGSRMVALDFDSADDRSALRALIERADLVLESSRPRALRHLGIDADDFVARGTTWVSITARGRAAEVVGFGDDVAAGAGLVTWSDNEPLPCGDALADPLTGVAAAAAAADALLDERARLVDVSMHHVAMAAGGAAAPPHSVRRQGDSWWLDCAEGEFPIVDPVGRAPMMTAGEIGTDTASILG